MDNLEIEDGDCNASLPSEKESGCIEHFCQEWVKNKQQQEEIRDNKKQWNAKKKELAQELMTYLKSANATCVPIAVDKKNLYLRLMNSAGRKQIGDKTLTEAFDKINQEIIEQIFEMLYKQNKKVPSIFQVLCEVIVQVTKDTCSYRKEYVTISTSKERSIRKEPAKKKQKKGPSASVSVQVEKPLVLPKAIKKKTLKFYRITEKIKSENIRGRQSSLGLRKIAKASRSQPIVQVQVVNNIIQQPLPNGIPSQTTVVNDVQVQTLGQQPPLPGTEQAMYAPTISSLPKGQAQGEIISQQDTFEQVDEPVSSSLTKKKTPCTPKKRAESPPIEEDTKLLSAYLNRTNETKSAKILMKGDDSESNEEIPYMLKEKEHVKTPQFRVSELKPTVEKVAKQLFEIAHVDPKLPFSKELIHDLLDKDLLTNLLKQLIDAVYNRRKELATRHKAITLDKVKSRKRKSPDSECGEQNNLDSEDDNEEGSDTEDFNDFVDY